MIIDKDLLDQLCTTAHIDISSDDKSDYSSFLHKLESVVHLFKYLDEIESPKDSDQSNGAPYRLDEVNYESLINYLDNTSQFNRQEHMFEVPKVIDSE